jgi:penicillin-insensitive murein DD-endopeptidase
MLKLRPMALLLVFFSFFGFTSASAKDNPWQAFKTPTEDPARAIGDYSSGCLQGAQPLPLVGEGYQVMHPSRVRYYGHPNLISFIETLGRKMREAGFNIVLLGDLSQPRGGRAFGGHASHQTGLDVDIWFWYPKKAAVRTLTKQEVEQLKARSILDSKTASVQAQWLKYAHTLLRLTAEDPRVSRVFVHPIIKRDLCALPGKDRQWLGKIRPWHGHDDHLHVRLACPEDSPDCVPQAPLPQGDGCAELEWWFNEEARDDRREALKRYVSKVSSERKLPAQCYEMLK